MRTWTLKQFLDEFRGVPPDILKAQTAPAFLLLSSTAESEEGHPDHFETGVVKSFSLSAADTLNDTTVYALEAEKGGRPTFMISVGRSERCDIRLDHSGVSKFHAYFRPSEDMESFSIKDAGSKNGTIVDNRRLEPEEQVPIRGGAAIDFGGAFAGSFHTYRTMFDHVRLFATML